MRPRGTSEEAWEIRREAPRRAPPRERLDDGSRCSWEAAIEAVRRSDGFHVIDRRSVPKRDGASQ